MSIYELMYDIRLPICCNFCNRREFSAHAMISHCRVTHSRRWTKWLCDYYLRYPGDPMTAFRIV